MRIYSDANPYSLFVKARRSLIEVEGYADTDLPDAASTERWHPDRSIALSPALPQWRGYYSADMTFYVEDDGTKHVVRSPFRPQSRDLRGWKAAYSATFNQWGIMLGAMIDAATEQGSLLRIGGYDPMGRQALRHPETGERFESSEEMFNLATSGQFTRPNRIANRETLLSCTLHRWESTPDYLYGGHLSVCRKCGHTHRFGRDLQPGVEKAGA